MDIFETFTDIEEKYSRKPPEIVFHYQRTYGSLFHKSLPGFLPGGQGRRPLKQFVPFGDFPLLNFGQKTIEKSA